MRLLKPVDADREAVRAEMVDIYMRDSEGDGRVVILEDEELENIVDLTSAVRETMDKLASALEDRVITPGEYWDADHDVIESYFNRVKIIIGVDRYVTVFENENTRFILMDREAFVESVERERGQS